MDSPAVRVLRGDVVESVHHASIAVADRQGRLVASYGNPRLVTFLRSTAKPLQALPVIETGAARAFSLTQRDLAIIAASHNGEPVHVRLVRDILDRIGLGVEALQCGAHAPYGKEAADRVGKDFTALHHNCSGKHAGMLAVCVHKGWDTTTYLEPEHPLQVMIRGMLADECGLKSKGVQLGIDGCSAPNFAVPLHRAARAFARLMDPEKVPGQRGRSLKALRDAMLAEPALVAGEDRTDTQVMRAFPGTVWAKAGAEACYAFGLPGEGWGGVVKVEDGASRAVGTLLARVLAELGARPPPGAPVRLEEEEPVRNWAGKTVGRIECRLRLRWASGRRPTSVRAPAERRAYTARAV